jgi:lipopolysaccharide/colanic/teichoic acid biosynthesis glycosyltransferase
MYRWVKRLVDFTVAALLLILLMPILLLVALLVRFKLGAPVLFCQLRPGKDCKPFKMYKFRTMLDELAPDGNPLPDDQRLTPFGKSLRATSLDELPELFNVLKGDMSLIGPRPLLMEYLSLYNEFQSRRHEVRPGITGWAQVNGRNQISWEDKFKHDVWYVDNCSLFTDIKIVFLSVKTVLSKEGVSEEGQATASKFSGSEH